MAAALDRVYREDSRRILATLIRLLRDFDLAEEALHDAFLAAAEQWPADGAPGNPVAWLVSTGRFRALDRVRRRAVYDQKLGLLAAELERVAEPVSDSDGTWPDDRLRLIFTCCHPALAPEARVALTLRTVCGLNTEEIARAFLVPAPTLAQRIVRAKAKIRDAGIPYVVPEPHEIHDRLEGVLQVVYLVFNEGYSPAAGASVTRADLAREAIRLGRLLVELTGDIEARGLLALMLLQDARRAARADSAGALVLLEDQDRTRWGQDQLAEGLGLVSRLLGEGEVGPYGIQAAIAAVHARARRVSDTDWPEVVRWYELLMTSSPTPVVALNHAVAVAMARGPAEGLQLVEAIIARGELRGYVHLHSARAELLHRVGRDADAWLAFQEAHRLATNDAERAHLGRRMAVLRPG
ncbi:MAG: RNA polymerase sigma factor [Gemmatimonadetes bacterium]|nr:RNA polymerase sigma factor [Gemmatimonadota bacterium]